MLWQVAETSFQDYGANVMNVLKKFILACGLLMVPALVSAQAANPAPAPAAAEAKAVPAPVPGNAAAVAAAGEAPAAPAADAAAAPAAADDGSLPGYTPLACRMIAASISRNSSAPMAIMQNGSTM
jgi:hypothetical protein